MNTVKTVDLYGRDMGGKGRAPLIVLHGLLGSVRNWQMAGPDLAHAGVAHVIALDLRNHGKSPHTDTMSYDEMAADVIAWLDTRKVMRVQLMGHSMGGKVAMAVACRHPHRIARLVVLDIAPREYDEAPALREEFAAMNELNVGALHRREEAETFFATRISDPAMRRFMATNLERDDGGIWQWRLNLPGITAALPGLAKNPLRGGEMFEGDTLFISCGKSDRVREEDRGAILRHFPNARIETLVDSGHNPHVDAREDLVEAVKRFLR